MCADIVIVGGGPIGCWTAIQLKKRNPGLDVQIYERHAEYQRSHVLRLKQISVLLYSKLSRDPRERAFFEEVTGAKGATGLYTAAAKGKAVFVKTQDLEVALKHYCADLGIQVAHEKVESAAELMEKHPECKAFIGADGAHSRMRMEILGDDGVKAKDLQPTVDVKYQTRGKARAVRGYTDNLQTVDVTDFITVEYVGREKNGVTPVTVRFLIDQQTYDATPPATFREPLEIDDARLPEKLAKDVKAYLEFRKKNGFEDYIEGSAKLTKIMLSVYAAKKFAAVHKQDSREAAWFFVGDAAMGVPFFRALNAGMITGSQLGFILSRKGMSHRAMVNAYNTVRPLDVAWEFGVAKSKNAVIKTYEKTRPLFRYIPHKKPKQ